MKWCTIDKEFINYLKGFEPKIPDVNYGVTKLKPFFNPLFKVGNLVYVSQVTSPKPRHSLLKDDIDFIKLFVGTNLIGVVNLNYMFPVPSHLITEIEYSNIDMFKQFQSEKEKNSYIVLLKREMKEIKNKNIDRAAENLYQRKCTFPNDRVSKRCLEFKELEKYSINYEI
ncbi:type III toxin-antitoxin system ToxN/AbiQ family toxin [Cetobacterium sp. 2A]|uniref:type III toxin-antitoxin system ToxN/AbiQ family toxin n=1 Tax=Cetobacterium sp. 2A TaxID=2754723 RepID=UPI00163C8EC4|nr:type III toxin-antitoxin system ToxN/AbiQ family toxin [Cetobacterium sp. 2A]